MTKQEREACEWITEVGQITTASDDSLKRALITCDGRGEKIKEEALKELLSRAECEAYQDGVDAEREKWQ